MGELVEVKGVCPSEFETVRTAFVENFEKYGDLGASVCVVRDGEILVHLWAGSRDKAQTLPWQQDTQVNIFSAGKPLVAVTVLQLAAAGKLDLDLPIAHYWPEFGQQGKDSITTRQVLCHRSGINAFHPRLQDEDIYDWARMIGYLEAETPWWQPDTEQGYSPMVYGWLLGELVKRVTGADSFNQVFQQTIAEPLGMRCEFGVASERLDALADVVPSAVKPTQTNNGSLVNLMHADPRGVINQAFSNPPSLLFGTNSPAWRQAQIPAANGHGTADALALFYGDLANRQGSRLLPQGAESCWQEQTRAKDKLLAQDLGFSLGFMMLPEGGRRCGHPGAGGSFGFADADQGLGFGYVTRTLGQSILVDYRAEQLQNAVYQCLEK
ncbi:serine hydrolase domain-containing protein [Maricurvus nonylphenolicus]|uniref:serine hydrolase domain-containing protein n=1 Tax=Maricurvus nonylphenolicus TaxID=1008307 RepID=UPI0036F34D4A